ncbi:MAG: DUF2520 domain-containing protein [Alistipes sp.]
MKKVVIIGSGNLAEALARAIAKSDLTLVQLFARNAERACAVAQIAQTVWTSDPAQLAQADIYLIAVSDGAVGDFAASLPIPVTAVVAHTAGSVALDVLPAKYARRAVFYPLQTFTKGREVDFSQIPIFLETSTPELRTQLETFARVLSPTVIYADSTLRSKVHLAGVFACNFANHMYALGATIAREAGVSFEVLKPLIAETAAKAVDADSPAEVQTGPAVRHDLATEQRHLTMLAEQEQLRKIYSIISENIWETSRKI